MARARRRGIDSAQSTVERGLTIDVRGDELIARLATRIQWHKLSGEATEGQLRKLRDLERGADDLAAAMRRDPARAELERKLRHHQERVTYLTFVRDHLRKTTTYRLGGVDLRMIEIMPEPF